MSDSDFSDSDDDFSDYNDEFSDCDDSNEEFLLRDLIAQAKADPFTGKMLVSYFDNLIFYVREGVVRKASIADPEDDIVFYDSVCVDIYDVRSKPPLRGGCRIDKIIVANCGLGILDLDGNFLVRLDDGTVNTLAKHVVDIFEIAGTTFLEVESPENETLAGQKYLTLNNDNIVTDIVLSEDQTVGADEISEDPFCIGFVDQPLEVNGYGNIILSSNNELIITRDGHQWTLDNVLVFYVHEFIDDAISAITTNGDVYHARRIRDGKKFGSIIWSRNPKYANIIGAMEIICDTESSVAYIDHDGYVHFNSDRATLTHIIIDLPQTQLVKKALQ